MVVYPGWYGRHSREAGIPTMVPGVYIGGIPTYPPWYHGVHIGRHTPPSWVHREAYTTLRGY